jgi:hypothetical protein
MTLVVVIHGIWLNQGRWLRAGNNKNPRKKASRLTEFKRHNRGNRQGFVSLDLRRLPYSDTGCEKAEGSSTEPLCRDASKAGVGFFEAGRSTQFLMMGIISPAEGLQCDLKGQRSR